MRDDGAQIRSTFVACYFACAVNLAAGSAHGEIKLLGTARLSGDSTDISGLTDSLAGGVPHNRLGGISAIDFTGQANEYLLASDRGPGDGATYYACRFHRIVLEARPGQPSVVTAKITATTMFIGVLAICGMPFFAGWYSKDAILVSAYSFVHDYTQHALLFALPLVTAGLTTFYMFRMWFMTFTGPPRDELVHEHAPGDITGNPRGCGVDNPVCGICQESHRCASGHLTKWRGDRAQGDIER